MSDHMDEEESLEGQIQGIRDDMGSTRSLRLVGPAERMIFMKQLLNLKLLFIGKLEPVSLKDFDSIV